MESTFKKNISLIRKEKKELLPFVDIIKKKNAFREEEVPYQSYLNQTKKEQRGVIIVLGFGSGREALELVETRDNISHFFFFEKKPEVFLAALFKNDFQKLLSDQRVHIYLGEQEDIMTCLEPGIKALRLENIQTLKHIPSSESDPEGYENLREAIFKEINQLNISGNTLMQYGDTFFINRVNQLPLLRRHRLLEELKLSFEGIPAIIVAGGPSLNKDLEVLKKISGKALIIAVDTVLTLLTKREIFPNFISSLDYAKATYEKFAEAAQAAADKVSLIAMPFVCEKIPKTFPFKEVFWAFNSSNTERWLNKLAGGSIENGGAGTVAHMNFIAAVVLGCSPIVLLGQDLSYSEGKATHAEGTIISENKALKELLASGEAMRVPTNNGKTAISNRAYFNFKHVFEDMIKANPGHYINSTMEGIVIEGAEAMPLSEVMDKFCQKPLDIEKIIETSLKNSQRTQDADLYEKELSSTLKNIKKIVDILKTSIEEGELALDEIKRLKTHNKNYQSLQSLPDKLRKKIYLIDKKHNQADREEIWRLIEDLTLSGLKKTERMQIEIDRLNKSGPFIDWLLMSLKRLNEVARIRLHWILFLENQLKNSLDKIEKDPFYHPKLYKNKKDKLLYYMQSQNLRFASILLEGFEEAEKTEDKLLLFLQGQLAAIYCNFEKARSIFAKLKGTEFEKDIEDFLDEWAKEYLYYAEWAEGESLTTLRMLKKGLELCPRDQRLINFLSRHFRIDLALMLKDREDKSTFDIWTGWLDEHKDAALLLPDKEYADFLKLSAEEKLKEDGYKEAEDLFKKALERREDAKTHIELMRIYFETEDFEEGLKHLEKATELDADSALHWEEIGDKLEEKGEDKSAFEAYLRGLKALPENPSFYLKAGQLLLKYGEIEEAKSLLENYKLLIEKDPEESINKLEKARELLERGENQKALELLVPIQEDYKDNSDFWHSFGLACNFTGRIIDAERCFREAIALKPDYGEAYYHLALLLDENGYSQKAKEIYNKALECEPLLNQAHTNLGSLAFREGDYEKAALHFEKAIDINPLNADSYFNYGKAMELKGDRERALWAFKQSMGLEPNHIMAQKAHEELLQLKTI